MSLAELIYIAAIVLIGGPASFRVAGWSGFVPALRVRNPVAFAMVATWFACRLLYWGTGQGMVPEVMAVSDMFVIAAMFVKDDWRCCPYRNRWHQIACLWLERTPWDRGILALFPVAWWLYTPVLPPLVQYWVLWGIGLAQLALAGLEGLHSWQRSNGQTPRAAAPGEPPGFRFATAQGRWNV